MSNETKSWTVDQGKKPLGDLSRAVTLTDVWYEKNSLAAIWGDDLIGPRGEAGISTRKYGG